jgi:hypothetical protein
MMPINNTVIPGVEIEVGVDYKGRSYEGEYFIRESHFTDGPGYFIWQYSGGDKWLYRMAARPDVAPRKYKCWNVRTRRGWKTVKEAQEILEKILELGTVQPANA